MSIEVLWVERVKAHVPGGAASGPQRQRGGPPPPNEPEADAERAEVARLRALVARAAVYIDTAADTIESMQGDDLDGECEEARDFVKELRKVLE